MKAKPVALLVVVIVALVQVVNSNGQTAGGSAGTSVLSVVSGLPGQPGGANPLAGKTLVLFKESFAGFLKRKGMFQGPPGSSNNVSPLAAWIYACKTSSPVCQPQARVK
jgi:hypothetical protein